jgi:hypothetical protein
MCLILCNQGQNSRHILTFQEEIQSCSNCNNKADRTWYLLYQFLSQFFFHQCQVENATYSNKAKTARSSTKVHHKKCLKTVHSWGKKPVVFQKGVKELKTCKDINATYPAATDIGSYSINFVLNIKQCLTAWSSISQMFQSWTT